MLVDEDSQAVTVYADSHSFVLTGGQAVLVHQFCLDEWSSNACACRYLVLLRYFASFELMP